MDKFELFDNIEKAIIYLTDNNKIGKMVVQKSIFLYLIDFSRINRIRLNDLLSMLNFAPYKFGPYSDTVDGMVDELEGYKKLIRNNNKIVSYNKINDYKYNEDEISILGEIKKLTKKLTVNELLDYVYFNSVLPEGTREYYTSNSEIKNKLEKEKSKFNSGRSEGKLSYTTDNGMLKGANKGSDILSANLSLLDKGIKMGKWKFNREELYDR